MSTTYSTESTSKGDPSGAPDSSGMIPAAAPKDMVLASTEVLAHHSRSFRLASLFLPVAVRGDAAVLYALCRLIDDLADESEDEERAALYLNQLRDELREVRPPRPLVAEFLRVVQRSNLNIDYAMELITGVESDLKEVLIEDDEELLQYCYRVAGTVGLMMCALLGVDEEEGLAHAIDLGIGMQMTNICRDVLEDAERGRVYIPESRLQKAGLSHEDILEGSADKDALAQVVDEVLELAQRYYDSADQGMRYIPLRSRLAIVVASRVYRAIGVHLRRGGTDVMAGRTVVPTWAKVYWVSVAMMMWVLLSLPLLSAAGHRSSLHEALKGLPGVSV